MFVYISRFNQPWTEIESTKLVAWHMEVDSISTQPYNTCPTPTFIIRAWAASNIHYNVSPPLNAWIWSQRHRQGDSSSYLLSSTSCQLLIWSQVPRWLISILNWDNNELELIIFVDGLKAPNTETLSPSWSTFRRFSLKEMGEGCFVRSSLWL